MPSTDVHISGISSITVLEVQLARHETAPFVPSFRNLDVAEAPRSPMKATLRFFCLAVVFLIARQSAFAQGAATGDLHITVKDPKGSVVTNATVIVRDAAKGLERTGTGDGQGGYSAR
ncbi:MAG: carboxypeptidase-like regulatory domain-containing protein, partial [Terriglobales bacterium]